MQWEDLLEKVQKRPFKVLDEKWVFHFMSFIAENLDQGSSSVSIKHSDKVKTHTSWHRKMCCNVPVIQEQDRRGTWILWECLVQLWGTFVALWEVDSKNNGFWQLQTPGEVLERPWHSVICTASVAMSKRGVIEPLWFEDADGEAVTVTKEHLIVVLNKFWSDLTTNSLIGWSADTRSINGLHIHVCLQCNGCHLEHMLQ